MEGDILALSPVCCQVCVSMYLDNGGLSSCGNLNPTWETVEYQTVQTAT